MLATSAGAEEHPFFEHRSTDRLGLVLVTSDRGLCGAFNTNLCRETERVLAEASDSKRSKLIVVGRKGNQYFRHRQVAISKSFESLGDQVDFPMVQTITRAAVDPFLDKEVDRVAIVTTKFISAAKREVVVRPFLPIERSAAEGEGSTNRDYLYEPSQAEIFDQLLPRYTRALFYSILAESFASEHSARMLAMGNATRNAGDMIDELILLRNRLRQAAITAELADIGGAVEALS